MSPIFFRIFPIDSGLYESPTMLTALTIVKTLRHFCYMNNDDGEYDLDNLCKLDANIKLWRSQLFTVSIIS